MKIDFEIDEKGKIGINLFDMLYEMDEDAKRELLEQNGWMSFVTDAMADEIIEGVAGKNYNSLVYKMREKLLNSDAMPVILRKWVEEVLHQAQLREKETERFRSAYYNLIGYIRKNYYNITREEGFPEESKWEYVRLDNETYQDILKHADAVSSLFPEVTDENSL